jgi:hypothetical protein
LSPARFGPAQNSSTTAATSKPVELLNMLRSAPESRSGPVPGPVSSPGPSPGPRTSPAPAPAPQQADHLLASILIGIAILLIVTGITYLILR